MYLSLWISLLCEMLSYAFERSTYTASVGFFPVLCVCMSLSIDCSAIVVFEPGLNAYCLGEIRLFVRVVYLVIKIHGMPHKGVPPKRKPKQGSGNMGHLQLYSHP